MKIIHLEGGLGDIILNLHYNQILELDKAQVNIFTNNPNAWQLFDDTGIEVKQYEHALRNESKYRTENYIPLPRNPWKPLDFPIKKNRLSTLLSFQNYTIYHPWSHGKEREIPYYIRQQLEAVLGNAYLHSYYVPKYNHELTPSELYIACRFAKNIVSSFSYPASIAWLLNKPLYLIYPQNIWDWQVPLQTWNQNMQRHIDESIHSYRVNYEDFNYAHFKTWLAA